MRVETVEILKFSFGKNSLHWLIVYEPLALPELEFEIM